MGLFSRKQPDPPVRNDQVRRLLKLAMEETDAADRGLDADEGSRAHLAFVQARDRLDAACRNSTQGEMRVAHEVAQRHGY